IGEMEDAATIDTALKAAETGHLVISSQHTPDAVSTITRVVSMFPTEEQEVARMRLCEALQAVVSQRLLPRADGHGRVPAVEILICTAVARDLMKDPARMGELHDYIAEAREQHGTQTFDQHLIELVKDEVVTYEAAVAAATNLKEFERQLRDERRRTRVATPAEATPRRRWSGDGTAARGRARSHHDAVRPDDRGGRLRPPARQRHAPGAGRARRGRGGGLYGGVGAARAGRAASHGGVGQGHPARPAVARGRYGRRIHATSRRPQPGGRRGRRGRGAGAPPELLRGGRLAGEPGRVL